ncbi:MAG: hypothetical protein MJ183_05350 [Treponemataceae bacterium]|nr:hypothetical protein [Treponemataceae bacterium]
MILFKKLFAVLFSVLIGCSFLSGQVALKSLEEDYCDFLSIQGLIERPTLNYRTLSDNLWIFDSENHWWSENNMGSEFILWTPDSTSKNWFSDGIKQGLFLRVYGPEWFNSYNTKSPYGQNDGALWQGRGYNTSVTAGVRLEGYGFELTFKPQISFSQNLPFKYRNTETYSDPKFDGRADTYGYFWGYGSEGSIDKPLRFGDKSFCFFDLGDTEIRYSWHSLTAGFGTQTPWIGPAWLNPMLGSNNAPSYPKFDIGLRKQNVILPGANLDLGYIEGRLWVGKLTESEWFDNDPSNDQQLLAGFNASYSPSFLPGFTLGLNKVCLAGWNNKFWKYLNPFYKDNDVYGIGEDQKMSITVDWLFPKVDFEVYGELAKDDYSANFLINPFHTVTFSIGFKQIIDIFSKNDMKLELIGELNNMEMSQDFQLQWQYFGLYGHHQINHGYTNKGQVLGNGCSVGGNSQYFCARIYHPRFVITGFLHRYAPDMNFVLNKAVDSDASSDGDGLTPGQLNNDWWENYEVHCAVGADVYYYVLPSVTVNAGFTFETINKPNYDKQTYMQNCSFRMGIAYKI